MFIDKRTLESLSSFAANARLIAMTRQTHRGQGLPDAPCTHFHAATGTLIIFTRDEGMHSSGWFKNPDYDKCLHLSLSFADPVTHQRRPFDEKLADAWVDAFFPNDKKLVWMESAKMPTARAIVTHYRVFCDENWQPILPRGEVYSTEFTEKGWKSWSEQHPDQPNAYHLQYEDPDK